MPTHMYSWSERYNDVKVSSENIGLLCSRSRSQMMFRISINVCLDIFWTTELFVAKVGMVIIVKSQTVVPPNNWLLSSRPWSQGGLMQSEYDCTILEG